MDNTTLTDPQLIAFHQSTIIPIISIELIGIFIIFALVYVFFSMAKVKKFWAIWWVSLLFSGALWSFLYLSPVTTQTIIKTLSGG